MLFGIIRLSNYIGESRNLIRTTEKHKRLKLLHTGKLDVVAFLSKLPKTTHDVNSFVIDMPVAVVRIASNNE
jgi:nuclear RNA export factor